MSQNRVVAVNRVSEAVKKVIRQTGNLPIQTRGNVGNNTLTNIAARLQGIRAQIDKALAEIEGAKMWNEPKRGRRDASTN